MFFERSSRTVFFRKAFTFTPLTVNRKPCTVNREPLTVSREPLTKYPNIQFAQHEKPISIYPFGSLACTRLRYPAKDNELANPKKAPILGWTKP
jgi:hypothetical protein